MRLRSNYNRSESSSSTSIPSFESKNDTEIVIANTDSVEDDSRTVSRSLKRAIHKDFDYNIFLQSMEALQNECTLSMYGMSQAIGSLNESIISGAIFSSKPKFYFDYSCTGLKDIEAHLRKTPIENNKFDYDKFVSSSR
ncbi:uncharacterized protein EV154DRAFT_563421 [Mucor mucedo]|uniref:uncharacterized protein n=1 Tax=Mucor mucedo TaxID=29922 RepID=UPI00221FBEAC|nr:uncharacterized protein EV154DRAFT_563421 [Mucor mucedo]KAI7891287.1 hypothetical protein EV154DRAFT_563421 [Mucor mucedo]